MTRRSFTLEPQRLVPDAGYRPCEPHQACRVVIKEITIVPASKGRRSYRIEKNHAIFCGSGMMLRARLELDVLIRGTNPRPRPTSEPWGRSLGLAQYLQLKGLPGR